MILATKQQLRQSVRSLRKQLSVEQQQVAALQLASRVMQRVSNSNRVALFLSMDGEISTGLAISQLWQAQIAVYLPVVHPLNRQHLLFIRYQPETPLRRSPLGMLEPLVQCHQICPLNQLDLLFTPLVAFDPQGHRLGMGGGFYDRTLEQHYQQHRVQPTIIGLAHDCQKVAHVPVESWDIALDEIITPSWHFQW